MASNNDDQELEKNNIQRNEGSVKRPVPAGGKPKPKIAKKPSVSSKPPKLPSQNSVDLVRGSNSPDNVFSPQLHKRTQAASQLPKEHTSYDPSLQNLTIPAESETTSSPSAQHSTSGFNDVSDCADQLLSKKVDPVLQGNSKESSTNGVCLTTPQVQGCDLSLQYKVNNPNQETCLSPAGSNYVLENGEPVDVQKSARSSRKPPSVSPKPRKTSLTPESKQSPCSTEHNGMDISPKSENEQYSYSQQEQHKSLSNSVLSKVSIFSEQINQQRSSQVPPVHCWSGQVDKTNSFSEKQLKNKTGVSRSLTVSSLEKRTVITQSNTTDGELLPREVESPVKDDKSNIQRSQSTVTMRPKPTPRVSPKGGKPVPVPRKRLSLGRKMAEEGITKDSDSCNTLSVSSSMTSVTPLTLSMTSVTSLTSSMTSVTSLTSSMTSQVTSSNQNEESSNDTNDLPLEIESDQSDANNKDGSIISMDTTTPPPPPLIPPKQNTEEVKNRYVNLNKSDDDTSSLLNDIEKIINEAFDVSPKPRAVSLDTSPSRPPRKKRQCCNPDATEYNSDSEFTVLRKDSHKGSTQSLNALEISSSNRKPCPPKPVRKKLINGKNNRSQSDLGDIHQFVLMKETGMKLNHEVKVDTVRDRSTVPQMRDKSNIQIVSNRGNSCILTPDTRVPPNQEAIIREKLKERSKSLPSSRKKSRPKRPAPPPPLPGTNLLPSGDMNLASVNSPDEDQENPYFEIKDLPKTDKVKTYLPPELPPRNETYPRKLSAPQVSPVSSTCLERPMSIISNQSDSGSISQGSPAQGSSSSDEENLDQDTRKEQKRLKKIRFIASEIASSERVFVDVLKLLNIDFRLHISKAEEEAGKTIVPKEYIDKILSHLPQLQNFNEDLLKDMESRIEKWDESPQISDIFIKKGPFLKLYTSYIQDFSDMTAILDEALKKLPQFKSVVKEFETSPRCACLSIRQHMLKPIQRIPQYKLLLQDYLKHLTTDSPDYENTKSAIVIVSTVADHANDSMKQGDHVQRMLEIQKSLDGNFEVIKPGRLFIKAGELMKLSRKEMQARMFFLFNDVLLITTPTATGGYRLNQVLTLTGMKVYMSTHDEFSNEFNIISTQKSFTVEAKTKADKNAWIDTLNQAVKENTEKRNTFEKMQVPDCDFKKGEKAPVWIPDSRVTMCMMCTSEFSVIHRRHHCRACGKVLCSYCSMNKVPLKYLKDKLGRVCKECYDELNPDDVDDEDVEILYHQKSPFGFIKGKLFRKSNNKPSRPKRYLEVHANDQDSQMCGYLRVLQKGKWKKFWHLLKDKVLYTYGAREDTAAVEIKPVVGYEVAGFNEIYDGIHQSVLFQLKHQNQKPIIFQGDNASITERWIKVMKEASVP